MRYQYWQDYKIGDTMPFVFKKDVRTPNNAYDLHWHKAVEIIWVTDGEIRIRNNEKEFIGRVGDILCIHSTHLHSFQPLTKCTYYCIILPEETVGEKQLFQSPLPYRTTDAKCVDLYRQIVETIRGKPPFYQSLTNTLLRQLYIFLATVGGDQCIGDERRMSAAVREAILYIEKHYAERLTLQDIASAVGVSRYHLCHIFKAVTGTTPALYWQRIRCTAARELLKTGYSVSEAAEACGFSSYAYFAKVYQKQFSVPPAKDKA